MNGKADDLISRQTAIKAIEDLQDCYNGFSDTYDKACIIGVLEELPSAERDYKFDEWCTDCKEYDHERHCCPRFNHVIRTTLKEVQEERKNGKWIEENTRPRSSQFYCSVCHRTAYDPQPTRIKGWTKRCRYAFCPNCGADMRGEKNE